MTPTKGSTVSVPQVIIAGYMPELLDLEGEAESVAFAWQKVIRDSTLPSSTKLAGFALASRMNKKGQCRPSVATLATDMGVSSRTAHRAKANLVFLGLITITNPGQKKADGSYAAHRLQAAFPPLTDLSGETDPIVVSDSTPTVTVTAPVLPHRQEVLSQLQYPPGTVTVPSCHSGSVRRTQGSAQEGPSGRAQEEPNGTLLVSLRSTNINPFHFSILARRGIRAARKAHLAEIQKSPVSARRGMEAARLAHLAEMEESPTPEVRESLEPSASQDHLAPFPRLENGQVDPAEFTRRLRAKSLPAAPGDRMRDRHLEPRRGFSYAACSSRPRPRARLSRYANRECFFALR